MDDVVSALDLPGEGDVPDPVLHASARRHQHGVVPDLVDEALLHLGHIDGSAPGKLPGLGVVDIGPVDGGDVILHVIGGLQHEAVVGGRRSEPDVGRDALVGVNARMHLDPAFLLPALGMPAGSLEQEAGEEACHGGVDDPQPFEPFGVPAFPAVRRKSVPEGGVEVTVDGLEDGFRPPRIRV